MSNHNARARSWQLPATLTVEEWTRTVADFQGLCAYCQDAPVETLDHFIPVSKGGGTTAGNCLPACLACNRAKHSQTRAWWMAAERIGELAEYLRARSTGGDTGTPIPPTVADRRGIQLTVRVPKSVAARLAAVAAAVGQPIGIKVSATELHRSLLLAALEAKEKELGLAPKKPGAKPGATK